MFSFFESLINPFSEYKFDKFMRGTLDFFWLHTKGIKKYLLLTAFFAACTAGIEVYLFGFLGNIIDSLSIQHPSNFWPDNKDSLIKISIVLLIVLPIVTSTHSMLCHQSLIGNFPLRVLFNIHQFLIKQSVKFYQNDSAGKISAKAVQLSTATRMALLTLVDIFVYAIIFFVSMSIMLAKVDFALMMPVLVWLIGYISIISIFVPKLKSLATNQAETRSDMVGKLVDTYTNIVTIKLFSHADTEKTYARSYMGNYLSAVHAQMRFISRIVITIWTLNILLIFSTGGLALYLWSGSYITSGAVAASIAVVLRVYTISHWILWEASAVFDNIGIVNDGLKLLSSPLIPIQDNKTMVLDADSYDITFNNVSFRYDAERDVIHKLNLNVTQGERIGIVGRSGSGKSTLIKLLLGFYKVHEGSIRIGGQNISDLSEEGLLSHIGVVTQDIELLNRSIKDNITFGGSDVSQSDVIAAAKMAKAHNFILDLVDSEGRRGYEAHAGERGVKLSGGQRQRIALTRAILKNAPILILDEATSALDSEVESEIMCNIETFMSGKTVIVIAHRLATLAHLDRIIVLDKGHISELGSHESLIERQGIYYKLWHKQSNKFKQGTVAI